MAQSITPQTGRQFILKASDGTSPTTFTTVGGLRNTDLTINGNPVDVSNVETSGWREWLVNGGIRDVVIAADGVLDSADTIMDIFEDAALDGDLVEAQVTSNKGDSFTGQWVVNSFRRTGTFDGAETFAIQITSDGVISHAD